MIEKWKARARELQRTYSGLTLENKIAGALAEAAAEEREACALIAMEEAKSRRDGTEAGTRQAVPAYQIAAAIRARGAPHD